MPNWSSNVIAIKGKESEMLKFFNVALKNSRLKKSNNVEEAFKMLDNATTREGHVCFDEETKKQVKNVNYDKRCSLQTFRKMPDTFLFYDTTNYPKEFDNARKYQIQHYGVAGWYDYNSLIALGTKWNTEMKSRTLEHQINGKYVFKFKCQTAWSYPLLWMKWVKKTFGLEVYFTAEEESYAYFGYGKIGGEFFDYSDKIDEAVKDLDSSKKEDEDEYYRKLDKFRDCIDKEFDFMIVND